MGKTKEGKKKQQPRCGGRLGDLNARVRCTAASAFLLVIMLAVCEIPMRAANAINVDTIEGVCGQGLTHDNDTHHQSKCKAIETENAASEEQLGHLMQKGKAAFQTGDFAKANALFDQISREAGISPSWNQMSLVHYFNGMALIQLEDGVRALWCFKNAMYLANQRSKRPQQSPGSRQKLAQFSQQLQNTVMEAGKNFYVAASVALQNGRGDAGQFYTAAQYAHAVGKLEETKKMIGALVELRPDHGGAVLLLGLVAKSENQNAKALKFLRKASRLEQLPPDASPLWQELAGMECEIKKTADACANAWRRTFEAEIVLVPMNTDSAYQAAVSFGNIKLETINGGNADAVIEEVVAFGQRATRLGLLNAPLQLPQKLIRGVSFALYRDDAPPWKVVRHLEDNFEAIRDEIVEADAAGRLRQTANLDHEKLHTAGEWRELNVVAHGRVNEKAVELLPITSNIVFGIRDAVSMVLGGIKISLMQPGTVVRPHTGQTNARLRIHLGVSIPPGPRLCVGNETRSWTEGRCTVIDDSYVHEVWHPGDTRRIVLIVDVWHPEMDARQREDSLSDSSHLEVYRRMADDPAGELRRQGVPGDLVPSRFVSDAWHLDNVDDDGHSTRGREL